MGDSAAMALAAVANLVAFGLVIAMWRRGHRRVLPVRTGHPSTRSPVHVRGVDRDGAHLLSISVPKGSVRTTIDIVTVRSGDADWTAEPRFEPFDLQPGYATVIGEPLDSTTADVVVAWTAHHLDGDRRGSRLFRLPAARDAAGPLAPRMAVLAATQALLLLVLVIAASTAAAIAWVG